mgnify:CR=1 FL=1
MLDKGAMIRLPIEDVLGEVRAAIAARGVVVLQAPPGAGKTTLVPLHLLATTPGRILMLEPRRLAARGAAERMAETLGERLQGKWSLATALAFLAWFVFAPQCLSTIAVARRETNGWKWPLFMVAYLFGLAYVFAGITYWTAKAFGLSLPHTLASLPRIRSMTPGSRMGISIITARRAISRSISSKCLVHRRVW